jgi:hypothetical protein
MTPGALTGLSRVKFKTPGAQLVNTDRRILEVTMRRDFMALLQAASQDSNYLMGIIRGTARLMES